MVVLAAMVAACMRQLSDARDGWINLLPAVVDDEDGPTMPTGLAAIFGLPIGILGGIYLAEFGKANTAGFLVRYAADVINGVPSIVMGIFAYAVIVLPMKHFSTLAGGASAVSAAAARADSVAVRNAAAKT